jgi:hypothetical protein
MTLGELAPEIREALAIHTFAMKIGFLADQLYFHFITRPRTIAVTLRRDGRQASIFAGRTSLDHAEAVAAWSAACEWWNRSATREEKDQILEGSRVRRGAVNTVAELLAAGFNLSPGRDA